MNGAHNKSKLASITYIQDESKGMGQNLVVGYTQENNNKQLIYSYPFYICLNLTYNY